MLPRSFAAAVCALALVVPGCESPQPTQPVALDAVDRIELRAWRETLGPLYPLAITRSDSIAAVVAFFSPTTGWRDARSFPGTPILAAFLSGDRLVGEYGFVETSHQEGGFLVNRLDGRIRVRTASPADITRFLAFFGMSVEIRTN